MMNSNIKAKTPPVSFLSDKRLPEKTVSVEHLFQIGEIFAVIF